MAGAEFAVEDVLDARRFDEVFLRLGVEVGFGRREQDVDAGGNELVAVGLEGARVLVEILVRAELQAIDEDRRDHGVTVLACLFHQADVAGVQVAHGRHENDAATVGQRAAQVGDAGMDLHDLRQRRCVPGRGSCRP